MSNPCTRPSRFGTRGGSQEREEPQRDTSAPNWWEDYRSSPGSPEEPENADAEDAPYFEEEDEVAEQAAVLWIEEGDEFNDPYYEAATSSASATNPWVLYEAGIVCSREEDGSVERNSSGERVLNLREWAYLMTDQRVRLRHQGIRRPEWEKLPWTGHLCYLFTRAWELGRWKSQYKRAREFDAMRQVSENARLNGVDWMRGQPEPLNWENRHDIPMNSWHGKWLNYQRDIQIQDDMDWISEAAYQFYQVHLDKMIRKNGMLWGDFCRKRYVWNDAEIKYVTFLI